MKHLAAYLLLRLGGNDSPSSGDVKTVLGSVGIDADDDRLDKLIAELKGKDLNQVCYLPSVIRSVENVSNYCIQLISQGSAKLASVPSGGGGGGGGGAGTAAPAAGGGGAAAEVEKPAEKEEEKDESDEDMGFGLFD